MLGNPSYPHYLCVHLSQQSREIAKLHSDLRELKQNNEDLRKKVQFYFKYISHPSISSSLRVFVRSVGCDSVGPSQEEAYLHLQPTFVN